jgi:hypothetical protein
MIIFQAITTAEGEEYYWNQETNETRWEKPEEVLLILPTIFTRDIFLLTITVQ